MRRETSGVRQERRETLALSRKQPNTGYERRRRRRRRRRRTCH
jgi:hypothetical protein